MSSLDVQTIRYIDEPDVDYKQGLDKAETYTQLLAHGAHYATLFPDAYEQISRMGSKDGWFDHFRVGLKAERRGKFSGEAWMKEFGAILLPAMLIRVGEVAIQFKVPFGLAFIRLREVGRIKLNGRTAVWQPSEEPK